MSSPRSPEPELQSGVRSRRWRGPGVVPLRPVSGGEVIDGAFRAVLRNPRVMVGWSVGSQLLWGLVVAVLFPPRMVTAPSFTQPVSAAAVAAMIVLYWAMSFVLSGMLTVAVARLVLGNRISARQAWRYALPRLLAMIRTVLIPGVFLSGLWGSYALIGLGIRLVSSTRLMVVFFVSAGIPLLLFTCWLVLSFVLAVQVVVLEDAGPVAALRRSYVLVRGRRGQVFSTLLGATFQVGFASYLFNVPFQLAAVALTRNAAHPPLIAVAISIAGKLLVGALSLPLLAGMLVLLYVDLRIRKEGIAGALKGALQSEVLTASEFTSIWRPADSSASLPLENSSSLNLYLSRL